MPLPTSLADVFLTSAAGADARSSTAPRTSPPRRGANTRCCRPLGKRQSSATARGVGARTLRPARPALRLSGDEHEHRHLADMRAEFDFTPRIMVIGSVPPTTWPA